jgi:hypothetical protein
MITFTIQELYAMLLESGSDFGFRLWVVARESRRWLDRRDKYCRPHPVFDWDDEEQEEEQACVGWEAGRGASELTPANFWEFDEVYRYRA